MILARLVQARMANASDTFEMVTSCGVAWVDGKEVSTKIPPSSSGMPKKMSVTRDTMLSVIPP